MRVHSALPDRLTAALQAVLESDGVDHVGHGVGDPAAAAGAAAEHRSAGGRARSLDRGPLSWGVEFDNDVRLRVVSGSVTTTAALFARRL